MTLLDRNEYNVHSPKMDVAVRVTLVGQTTDDDWYMLEVCPVDAMGQSGNGGYRLEGGGRQPRNIGEVKFSRDGRTLVALEFDGSLIVWRQRETGRFDDLGHVVRIGVPISRLEIDDSGAQLTVQVAGGGVRTVMRSESTGQFALND